MKTLFIIVFIAIAVCVALLFSPMLALWSLNTISEQAMLGWYIPHNAWTYLASIVLILILAADVSPKSK